MWETQKALKILDKGRGGLERGEEDEQVKREEEREEEEGKEAEVTITKK